MAKPKAKQKSPKEQPQRAVGAAPAPVPAATSLPLAGQRKAASTRDRPPRARNASPEDSTTATATNGPPKRQAPGTVLGNTRVNLALPFSKIEVQEPSGDLVELAALVSDLLVALAEWVPEETLAELRTRAQALTSRLCT